MGEPDRPKKIKVGNVTYRIVFTDVMGDYGCCNTKSCLIYVDSSHALPVQVETLWHEVEHAIYSVAKLEGGESEEETVNRSTPIRVMVMKENPKLMRWILQ